MKLCNYVLAAIAASGISTANSQFVSITEFDRHYRLDASIGSADKSLKT